MGYSLTFDKFVVVRLQRGSLLCHDGFKSLKAGRMSHLTGLNMDSDFSVCHIRLLLTRIMTEMWRVSLNN